MDTITTVRNNGVNLINADLTRVFLFKGTPGNETTIVYCKHHRIKQGFIGYIKRAIDENVIGIVG